MKTLIQIVVLMNNAFYEFLMISNKNIGLPVDLLIL